MEITEHESRKQVSTIEHRYLGTSGLQISQLTYGNWITGLHNDDDLAVSCIRAALDIGITSFDTADGYADGHAEEVLGGALAGVRRDSIELFTKVYFPVGPEPRSKNDTGLSRKHILKGIEGSLRRLGTDYIDLYQAHRWDSFTPLEETMQAFADVVRSGKALYIGVSEWPAERIREGQAIARELGIPLVSNQPQYSMLWRIVEPEVIPTSAELGMSQLVFSPVAQGVLTGKYLPGQPPPAGSRRETGGGEFMNPRLFNDSTLAAVQELRPVADELNLSMAQLAIAWVLGNPNVASAIVGASRPSQLVDNAAAVGVTIPVEALERIDRALSGVAETDGELVRDRVPKARSL